VIGVTVLGLVASLGYSITQPKEYSASAQLLIQAEAGVTTAGNPQPITSTDVLTELQLMTSAPVEAAVTRQLGSAPNVTAAEVGQTNVISVTATAASPARAALIANAYATAFVTYQRSVTITNLAAAEMQLSRQITSTAAQAKALQSDPAAAAQVNALLSTETTLKDELAQLQVNGAVATEAVQLVSPATAPSGPSSPKPVRDALLGLLLGLLVGIGLALVLEHLDDTLYLKEDVERLTSGSRVLGLVPMVDTWKNRDQAFLIAVTRPNSVVGEAYRSLRTSLQFAALDGPARAILVTSASVGEGKSATVANLGVVLATAGERVVIVSCDLRRPRLARFFGLDDQVGLTTVLLGRCTLQEALQPVPGIDGLTILPTGQRPSDPTGVLGGDQLTLVFGQLSKIFDWVLIDSPPLLPVTDAVILSQAVDTTLLVVAAGQTRGRDLHRATEALTLVHAAIVGVVLNEVTRSTGYGYGYGKGYGKGYRYGRGYRYGKGYGYGTYAPTSATVDGDGPEPIGAGVGVAQASEDDAPAHGRSTKPK
jgi:capsular exopolysaccharide synthesis family protein